MKNTLVYIGIAILAAFLLYAVELHTLSLVQTNQGSAKLGEIVRFTGGVTNTSYACGSTAGNAVSANSARQYLALVNQSSSQNIYLSLGGTAVGSQGILLVAPGGSYEITQENLFTGAISCIASSTAILGVVEK